jgi:hypothetical protein
MISTERLTEIETAPREAGIFRAEAKELVDAYRERDEALALNAEWAKKAETWMASPEAAQRLEGYRELAQQVATAQRERDEARAEVKRLLGVLLEQVPHTYEGNCPDSHDATQRDPYCHACQILAATEAK